MASYSHKLLTGIDEANNAPLHRGLKGEKLQNWNQKLDMLHWSHTSYQPFLFIKLL